MKWNFKKTKQIFTFFQKNFLQKISNQERVIVFFVLFIYFYINWVHSQSRLLINMSNPSSNEVSRLYYENDNNEISFVLYHAVNVFNLLWGILYPNVDKIMMFSPSPKLCNTLLLLFKISSFRKNELSSDPDWAYFISTIDSIMTYFDTSCHPLSVERWILKIAEMWIEYFFK